MSNRAVLFAALVAAIAVPASVATSSSTQASTLKPGDHDYAREALRRGEILPITRILPAVLQRVPGDVIEIELDTHDDGRRIEYEIKILTPSGRVIEVKVDARTGRIREIEED
jgi:uncharacterized membrane protein YkoI